MAGRALESLCGLELSSFILNGYQVFFPGEKASEYEAFLSALPHAAPKSEVKLSWLVDKASLHIDIQLLFQKLDREIRLQTSHKLVRTSQQKRTPHTHTSNHTHTHPTHLPTHSHTHSEVWAICC